MDPRKTRPCKFFFDPNRTCQKGESCDFSHDPDAQNSQQERSNGPPRFGGSNNSRGGFGSGRGGFTGGSGSSRGGFTGGGGHLHQSSGGGGGGHQGNYHNKDNNEKYGGPTSSNNRGRPWRSRPDFPQKPHNNESREFPQKTNSGGSCKYFRQGTCNSGDKCKFKHTWTENDDLALVYSNSFGEDNVKTDDYEIRDVCVIDISKKFVAFANPKTIFFVDLGNAGISGNDFQTKNMGPTEELTCMRYFENAFIVGVYDNQKKCSLVKIISLDGNEFSIDPAHQDYILDICNIKDLIVTASLDEKIKFWRWNAINMKFEIAYTHPHKEMSKIKNLTYNGIDSLFVANSDFSLSVFTLDYTTPTLTLKLIGNYENYHSNIITTLKFFMLNQQTRKTLIEIRILKLLKFPFFRFNYFQL